MSAATSTLPRPVMGNRAYKVEVLQDDQWIDFEPLILLEDRALFAGVHVEHVRYDTVMNSIGLQLTLNGRRCDANIVFSAARQAFLGSYSNEQGDTRVIRGSGGYKESFATKRRPLGDPSAAFEPWLGFGVETDWGVDDHDKPDLKVTYTLGPYDITHRTTISRVDRATGVTTIEMLPEPDKKTRLKNPVIGNATFVIHLESSGETFSGTLTIEDKKYAFIGQLDELAARAKSNYFTALTAARPAPSTAGDSIQTAGPTLTLLELENVSPLQEYTYTDSDGKQQIGQRDAAQYMAGQYFNDGLINGLEGGVPGYKQDWLQDLFGGPIPLEPGVLDVFKTHKQFFRDNTVLGTGNTLYTNFKGADAYKETMTHVDKEALDQGWKGLSEKEPAEYQNVTNKLYIQGYHYGVTGIGPYLKETIAARICVPENQPPGIPCPTDWGKVYYDHLTNPHQIIQWQLQVKADEFENTVPRMYNWYTKVAILNPDGSPRPTDMLAKVFEALLGVRFEEAEWEPRLAPILAFVIANAQTGSLDKLAGDAMQKALAAANRETLNSIINCFQNAGMSFTDRLISAFEHFNAIEAYKNKAMMELITDEDFLEWLLPMGKFESEYKAWSELRALDNFWDVMAGIGWSLGAAAVIWSIFWNAQNPQDFENVVQEIGLGVFAVGLFVKGLETTMHAGIGRWMVGYWRHNNGGLADFAANLAKWFSKSGEVVPEGLTGKIVTKIFGKNSEEFFGKRLGPALAVFGLVLCSMSLADAIKAGDTAGIVFNAIYAFFALADAALSFLGAFGFAWAGPVGLAVAVVGLLVVIVNFFYSLFRTKPNPVKDFVKGPMKGQGFAYTPNAP